MQHQGENEISLSCFKLLVVVLVVQETEARFPHREDGGRGNITVGVWSRGEVLHWCHSGGVSSEEARWGGDRLSSMYQLHGSSTRVFSVGGEGAESGFIHVIAETSGEKLIGVIGGAEGRK